MDNQINIIESLENSTDMEFLLNYVYSDRVISPLEYVPVMDRLFEIKETNERALELARFHYVNLRTIQYNEQKGAI